jgi:hypothetical protein
VVEIQIPILGSIFWRCCGILCLILLAGCDGLMTRFLAD